MFKRFLILMSPLILFSLHQPGPPSIKPISHEAVIPSLEIPRESMPKDPPFMALKIRRGMTLQTLLAAAEIPAPQIQAAVKALGRQVNLRRIRAGETFFVFKNDVQGLTKLSYQPEPGFLISVIKDSLGKFVARRDTLPVHRKITLLHGEIQTTLYDAILRSGESPELILAFSDIFQWDIDFFIDPRRGDTFHILFEKVYIQDPFSRQWKEAGYGNILAAAYEKRDTTLIAYGYPDDRGRMRYYDENGRSFQKTFLKSPLNYRRITSYFSTRRRHPILKRVRAHTGVDFAAPTGTPVVASADGKIIHIGWKGGYGKCIKISHKNGTYVTLYGHLSRFARGLKKGAFVRQGQVIGYVGATGLATGPHLHYTMYYKARPINPLKIRPVAGKPISRETMSAFLRRAQWLKFRLGLSPVSRLAGLIPPEGWAR